MKLRLQDLPRSLRNLEIKTLFNAALSAALGHGFFLDQAPVFSPYLPLLETLVMSDATLVTEPQVSETLHTLSLFALDFPLVRHLPRGLTSLTVVYLGSLPEPMIDPRFPTHLELLSLGHS